MTAMVWLMTTMTFGTSRFGGQHAASSLIAVVYLLVVVTVVAAVDRKS